MFSFLSQKTGAPAHFSCAQYVNRPHEKDRSHVKHMVEIDWPDMNIPRIDDKFWAAFVADILRIAFNEGVARILCYCLGGHGRTGTALAIVYGLITKNGKLDPAIGQPFEFVQDLIQRIRELHCHKAVETNSQIDYIARVLSLPVKPRKPEPVVSTVDPWAGEAFQAPDGTYEVIQDPDVFEDVLKDLDDDKQELEIISAETMWLICQSIARYENGEVEKTEGLDPYNPRQNITTFTYKHGSVTKAFQTLQQLYDYLTEV